MTSMLEMQVGYATVTRESASIPPPAVNAVAPARYLTSSVSAGLNLAGRLWLGGEGFMLPVQADVTVESGVFFLVNEETGIFGSGNTVTEAVNDFRVAMHDHLDVLEASDALSPELARQLAFLRRHLRIQQ